jgi:aminoglycoside phosphotransferase (APT) family kinase protein
VLLDNSDGTWRPTGVVDWMTAEIGDPEADLSRTLAHHRFHGSDDYLSFISAYRTFHPARPGFEERFPLFMLWERMLIWEYGQRNGGWFPEGMTLRRWIEPFTRMLVTPPRG